MWLMKEYKSMRSASSHFPRALMKGNMHRKKFNISHIYVEISFYPAFVSNHPGSGNVS
jgi:hypothetical protein